MHSPVRTTAPEKARPARPRFRVTGPDLVAGMVFAVAGAMFVASAIAGRDGDLRLDGGGDLRSAIADRAAELEPLRAEVDDLTAQVAAIIQGANPGPALELTTQQIAALAPMVGLTEVIGPGVTVTLDDAPTPDPLPEGLTGDDYVVHQQDVQGVVNALWRGGASGVTVMGQRLISTSAVRCVGNTVILQGRVYSPPFVIQAVGEVEPLLAALDDEPAVRLFRQWSEVVGLGYSQQGSRELVLPAYSGPLSPAYAEVTQ